MRAPIVIFLILISQFSLSQNAFAKFGWSFRNYSILYGPTYSFTRIPSHSFELQFDKVYHGCTGHSNHKGVSLVASFGHDFQEYGIKGMYNPSRSARAVSRNFWLFPYLLLQANVTRTKEATSFKNELSASPGVGLTSLMFASNILTIRPQIEVGYRFNPNNLWNKSGFTANLRIGIGFNPRLWKMKRKSKNVD